EVSPCDRRRMGPSLFVGAGDHQRNDTELAHDRCEGDTCRDPREFFDEHAERELTTAGPAVLLRIPDAHAVVVDEDAVDVLRPLAPIGWPSATAPPFTFTMSSEAPSICADWIGTAANASLISSRPRSFASSPARFRARSVASAGTVCSDAKRSALIPYPTIS